MLAFATARAAVVLVPINFMLTAEEISYILGHSQARGFIVEAELIATAEEAIGGASGDGHHQGRADRRRRTRRAGLGRFRAVADHHHAARPTPHDRRRSAAAPDVHQRDRVAPQGRHALQSQPDVATTSARIVAGSMTADDVEIHSLPLYHCAQLDNFLATDIYLGATSIILPRPTPETVLRSIERTASPIIFAPPTVWIALLRSPRVRQVDLSSLRKGYYGASAMPARSCTRSASGCRTCSCGTSTARPRWRRWPPRSVPRSRSARRRGRAARASTSRRDPRRRPTLRVRPATVGEIAHRGPHLMLGYLDDPDKTAEAFRGGWFHSGDLGYYDEHGLLHVVDRKKDMIKTGGENVASREVEEVLYRHGACPGGRGVRPARIRVWVEAVVAAVVSRDGVHAHRGGTASPTAARTWPASRHPSRSSSSTRCPRTRAANCSNANAASHTIRAAVPERANAVPLTGHRRCRDGTSAVDSLP